MHRHQSNGTKAQSEFEWTGFELLICASLQLVLVYLAYRLDLSKNPTTISVSSCAIIFGLLFGSMLAIISKSEADRAGLDPDVFFFGLLPPIILEAGFSMKKRGFFANFSTILSLSVVGTLIATFITGGIIILAGRFGLITKLTPAEAYLFGSLISAVDPVATLAVFKKCDAPPLLFNLVFGESVLNDGVAIVAFGLFQEYVHQGTTEVNFNTALLIVLKVFGIGLGSIVLAAMVCSISAFLLKHADEALQEYPSYEISIVLLSAYLSYVVADVAGLSGIVALFFSGVLMSHYHLYNISSESATALTHLLSTLAFLAENFIFVYLGVSVVAYSGSFSWDWAFIATTIAACIIGRAFNIFPLCAISNFGRKDPIPLSYMTVIWFSGLRGAIAFALALNVWTPDKTHSRVIESTTLFVVIFTTMGFGMSTGPLLCYLGLAREPLNSHGHDDDDSSSIEVRLLGSSPTSKGISRAYDNEDLSHTEKTGIHGIWEKMDETYLKPVFGGNARGEIEPAISKTDLMHAHISE